MSAKTQQIINYNFHKWFPTLPCRHACSLGGKISQQQKVARAALHTALGEDAAHVAQRPSGKRESATENESVLETRVMKTGLAAFKK